MIKHVTAKVAFSKYSRIRLAVALPLPPGAYPYQSNFHEKMIASTFYVNYLFYRPPSIARKKIPLIRSRLSSMNCIMQKCILSRLSVDCSRLQRAAFSFRVHAQNITKTFFMRVFFISHFGTSTVRLSSLAAHLKV